MRYRSEEQLQAWKSEMGYEEVKQKMMEDPALNRYCLPVGEDEGNDVQTLKRVIVTPNIQPTEETLDMSCFLPAADKMDEDEEEMEEEDGEEEVPDLVDVEDEELLA